MAMFGGALQFGGVAADLDALNALLADPAQAILDGTIANYSGEITLAGIALTGDFAFSITQSGADPLVWDVHVAASDLAVDGGEAAATGAALSLTLEGMSASDDLPAIRGSLSAAAMQLSLGALGSLETGAATITLMDDGFDISAAGVTGTAEYGPATLSFADGDVAFARRTGVAGYGMMVEGTVSVQDDAGFQLPSGVMRLTYSALTEPATVGDAVIPAAVEGGTVLTLDLAEFDPVLSLDESGAVVIADALRLRGDVVLQNDGQRNLTLSDGSTILVDVTIAQGLGVDLTAGVEGAGISLSGVKFALALMTPVIGEGVFYALTSSEGTAGVTGLSALGLDAVPLEFSFAGYAGDLYDGLSFDLSDDPIHFLDLGLSLDMAEGGLSMGGALNVEVGGVASFSGEFTGEVLAGGEGVVLSTQGAALTVAYGGAELSLRDASLALALTNGAAGPGIAVQGTGSVFASVDGQEVEIASGATFRFSDLGEAFSQSVTLVTEVPVEGGQPDEVELVETVLQMETGADGAADVDLGALNLNGLVGEKLSEVAGAVSALAGGLGIDLDAESGTFGEPQSIFSEALPFIGVSLDSMLNLSDLLGVGAALDEFLSVALDIGDPSSFFSAWQLSDLTSARGAVNDYLAQRAAADPAFTAPAYVQEWMDAFSLDEAGEVVIPSLSATTDAILAYLQEEWLNAIDGLQGAAEDALGLSFQDNGIVLSFGGRIANAQTAEMNLADSLSDFGLTLDDALVLGLESALDLGFELAVDFLDGAADFTLTQADFGLSAYVDETELAARFGPVAVTAGLQGETLEGETRTKIFDFSGSVVQSEDGGLELGPLTDQATLTFLVGAEIEGVSMTQGAGAELTLTGGLLSSFAAAYDAAEDLDLGGVFDIDYSGFEKLIDLSGFSVSTLITALPDLFDNAAGAMSAVGADFTLPFTDMQLSVALEEAASGLRSVMDTDLFKLAGAIVEGGLDGSFSFDADGRILLSVETGTNAYGEEISLFSTSMTGYGLSFGEASFSIEEVIDGRTVALDAQIADVPLSTFVRYAADALSVEGDLLKLAGDAFADGAEALELKLVETIGGEEVARTISIDGFELGHALDFGGLPAGLDVAQALQMFNAEAAGFALADLLQLGDLAPTLSEDGSAVGFDAAALPGGAEALVGKVLLLGDLKLTLDSVEEADGIATFTLSEPVAPGTDLTALAGGIVTTLSDPSAIGAWLTEIAADQISFDGDLLAIAGTEGLGIDAASAFFQGGALFEAEAAEAFTLMQLAEDASLENAVSVALASAPAAADALLDLLTPAALPDTIQGFITALNGSGILPEGIVAAFDAATNTLTAQIAYSPLDVAVEAPLTLDYDLGGAVGLSVDAAADIAVGMDAAFTLFFDFDGEVLEGEGGALADDGSRVFTSTSGHFTDAMTGWIIEADGRSFVIESVVDENSVVLIGEAAGAIADAAYRLREGLVMGIEDVSAAIDAGLDVTDPEIAATIGSLGLTAGGEGSGSYLRFGLGAAMGFIGAEGATRFTLEQIAEGALVDAAGLTLTGGVVEAALKGITGNGPLAALPLEDLEFELYSADPLSMGDPVMVEFDPEAALDISGLGDALGLPSDALVVTVPDVSSITALADMSIEDVIAAIGAGIRTLDDLLTGQSFYSAALPFVNASLEDVLGVGADLTALLEDVDGAVIGTLDLIEAEIEAALGIADDDPENEKVDLFLLESGELGWRLHFTEELSQNLNFNFDVDDLAGSLGVDAGLMRSLTDVAGLGAEGDIALLARGDLVLEMVLGVDEAGGTYAEVSPFDDAEGLSGSYASVELSVVAQDLAATVNLGPAEIAISGGSLAFDGDGDAETADSARLLIGIAGDGAVVSAAGDVGMNLPLSLSVGGFDLTTLLSDPLALTLSGIDGNGLNELLELIDGVSALDPAAAFSFEVPDIAAILEDFDIGVSLLSLLEDPTRVVDGVDIVLGELQGMFEGMFEGDIPLIGAALTEAAGFLGDLRSGVVGDLRDLAVSTGDGGLIGVTADVLTQYLGAAGMGWLVGEVDVTLHDADGLQIGTYLENPDLMLTADSVEFSFTIADQLLSTGTDLPFDFDIPGFSVEIDGGLGLDMGWEANLGFGISLTDGIYLADQAGVGEELVFTADAYLAGENGAPFAGAAEVLIFNAALTDAGRRDGSASGVTVAASLDLNGDERGRITVGDLYGGRAFSEVVTATLDADAEVRLAARLSAEVGIDGVDMLVPDVVTDIVLDGYYGVSNGDVAAPEFNVGFENFSLDVGTTVTEVLLPIVEKIESFLDPIDPLLDLFAATTDRAPNLGLGFIGVSTPRDLIDLLLLLTGSPAVDWSFFDAADFVVNGLPDLLREIGESGLLPLGDIRGFGAGEVAPSTYRMEVALGGMGEEAKVSRLVNDGMTDEDARSLIALALENEAALSEGASRAAIADASLSQTVKSQLLQLDGMSASDASSFISSIASIDLSGAIANFRTLVTEAENLSRAAQEALLVGDGMSAAEAAQYLDVMDKVAEIKGQSSQGDSSGFDISGLFSAETWMGLFTGEAGDLFRYDMPTFELETGVSIPIPPSFGIGPISFGVSAFADMGMSFEFGFGYDTDGIIRAMDTGDWLQALDGFYIADFNADGEERNEIEASLRVGIDAGVSLAIARGGMDGAINIEAYGDFNDLVSPSLMLDADGNVVSYEMVSDGKIRGSEIYTMLTFEGGVDPLNLVNLGMGADFEVRAYADVFSPWKGGWSSVAEVYLVDLPLFDLSYEAAQPEGLSLGHVENGILYVHAGAMAALRGNFMNEDVAEEIILHDGTLFDGNVAVQYNGWYEEFLGVTKVVVDLGEGADILDATRLTTVAVEVTGGAGDDQITLGEAGGVADGGAGDDLLIGSDAADTLRGGAGADVIQAGGGDDVIDGGSGDDVIDGGAGADHYIMGDAWGDDRITESDGGTTIDFSGGAGPIEAVIRARGVEATAEGGALDFRGDVAEVITSQGDDVVTISDIPEGDIAVTDAGGSDLLQIRMNNPNSDKDAGTITFADTDGAGDFDRVSITQAWALETLTVDDGAVLNGRETVRFDGDLEQLEIVGRNTMVSETGVQAFGGDVNIQDAGDGVMNLGATGLRVAAEHYVENAAVSAGSVQFQLLESQTFTQDVTAADGGYAAVKLYGDDADLTLSSQIGIGGGGTGLIRLQAADGAIIDDGGDIVAVNGHLVLQAQGAIGGTGADGLSTQVGTLTAQTSTEGAGDITITEADDLTLTNTQPDPADGLAPLSLEAEFETGHWITDAGWTGGISDEWAGLLTGADAAEAVTTAGALELTLLGADAQLTLASGVVETRAGGDIAITADDVEFNAGAGTIQGAGGLTLQANDAAWEYRIGTAAEALDNPADLPRDYHENSFELDLQDIEAIADGFAQVEIGNAAIGNTMIIGDVGDLNQTRDFDGTLKDATVLSAQNVRVQGAVDASGEDLTVIAERLSIEAESATGRDTGGAPAGELLAGTVTLNVEEQIISQGRVIGEDAVTIDVGATDGAGEGGLAVSVYADAEMYGTSLRTDGSSSITVLNDGGVIDVDLSGAAKISGTIAADGAGGSVDIASDASLILLQGADVHAAGDDARVALSGADYLSLNFASAVQAGADYVEDAQTGVTSPQITGANGAVSLSSGAEMLIAGAVAASGALTVDSGAQAYAGDHLALESDADAVMFQLLQKETFFDNARSPYIENEAESYLLGYEDAYGIMVQGEIAVLGDGGALDLSSDDAVLVRAAIDMEGAGSTLALQSDTLVYVDAALNAGASITVTGGMEAGETLAGAAAPGADARGSSVYIDIPGQLLTREAGSSVSVTAAEDLDLDGQIIAGGTVTETGVAFTAEGADVALASGGQSHLDGGVLASGDIDLDAGSRGLDADEAGLIVTTAAGLTAGGDGAGTDGSTVSVAVEGDMQMMGRVISGGEVEQTITDGTLTGETVHWTDAASTVDISATGQAWIGGETVDVNGDPVVVGGTVLAQGDIAIAGGEIDTGTGLWIQGASVVASQDAASTVALSSAQDALIEGQVIAGGELVSEYDDEGRLRGREVQLTEGNTGSILIDAEDQVLLGRDLVAGDLIDIQGGDDPTDQPTGDAVLDAQLGKGVVMLGSTGIEVLNDGAAINIGGAGTIEIMASSITNQIASPDFALSGAGKLAADVRLAFVVQHASFEVLAEVTLEAAATAAHDSIPELVAYIETQLAAAAWTVGASTSPDHPEGASYPYLQQVDGEDVAEVSLSLDDNRLIWTSNVPMTLQALEGGAEIGLGAALLESVEPVSIMAGGEGATVNLGSSGADAGAVVIAGAVVAAGGLNVAGAGDAEQGFELKATGSLTTMDGDIVFDLGGDGVVQGEMNALAAGAKIDLSAEGNLQIEGALTADEAVVLTGGVDGAGVGLTVAATAQIATVADAEGEGGVDAITLTATGDVLLQGALGGESDSLSQLTVASTEGDVELDGTGGSIQTGARIDISGDEIRLDGAIVSTGNTGLTGDQALHVSAGSDLSITGDVSAEGAVLLEGAGDLTIANAPLTVSGAGEGLTVAMGGNVDLGRIVTDGETASAEGAEISVAGDVSLTAGGALTAISGAILAGAGDVTLDVAGLELGGTIMAGKQMTDEGVVDVAADKDLTLVLGGDADLLGQGVTDGAVADAAGALRATGTLDIQTGETPSTFVLPDGGLLDAGTMSIAATDLVQIEGVVTAETLDIAATDGIVRIHNTVTADALTITTDTADETGVALEIGVSDGSGLSAAEIDRINAASTLRAGGVGATAAIAVAGAVNVYGQIGDSAALADAAGDIDQFASVTITADGGVALSGDAGLHADAALDVEADSLAILGAAEVAAQGDVDLDIDGALVAGAGTTVSAGGDLDIAAASLVSAGIVQGGAVDIAAESTVSIQGAIGSDAGLEITAGLARGEAELEAHLDAPVDAAALAEDGDITLTGAGALAAEGAVSLNAGGDVTIAPTAETGALTTILRPELVTRQVGVQVDTGATTEEFAGVYYVEEAVITTTTETVQTGTASVEVGDTYDTYDLKLIQNGYYNAETEEFREYFVGAEAAETRDTAVNYYLDDYDWGTGTIPPRPDTAEWNELTDDQQSFLLEQMGFKRAYEVDMDLALETYTVHTNVLGQAAEQADTPAWAEEDLVWGETSVNGLNNVYIRAPEAMLQKIGNAATNAPVESFIETVGATRESAIERIYQISDSTWNVENSQLHTVTFYYPKSITISAQYTPEHPTLEIEWTKYHVTMPDVLYTGANFVSYEVDYVSDAQNWYYLKEEEDVSPYADGASVGQELTDDGVVTVVGSEVVTQAVWADDDSALTVRGAASADEVSWQAADVATDAAYEALNNWETTSERTAIPNAGTGVAYDRYEVGEDAFNYFGEASYAPRTDFVAPDDDGAGYVTLDGVMIYAADEYTESWSQSRWATYDINGDRWVEEDGSLYSLSSGRQSVVVGRLAEFLFPGDDSGKMPIALPDYGALRYFDSNNDLFTPNAAGVFDAKDYERWYLWDPIRLNLGLDGYTSKTYYDDVPYDIRSYIFTLYDSNLDDVIDNKLESFLENFHYESVSIEGELWVGDGKTVTIDMVDFDPAWFELWGNSGGYKEAWYYYYDRQYLSTLSEIYDDRDILNFAVTTVAEAVTGDVPIYETVETPVVSIVETAVNIYEETAVYDERFEGVTSAEMVEATGLSQDFDGATIDGAAIDIAAGGDVALTGVLQTEGDADVSAGGDVSVTGIAGSDDGETETFAAISQIEADNLTIAAGGAASLGGDTELAASGTAQVTAQDDVALNGAVSAEAGLTVTAGADGTGGISSGALNTVAAGNDATLILQAGAEDGSVLLNGTDLQAGAIDIDAAGGEIALTGGVAAADTVALDAQSGVEATLVSGDVTAGVSGAGDVDLTVYGDTALTDVAAADGDVTVEVYGDVDAVSVSAGGADGDVSITAYEVTTGGAALVHEASIADSGEALALLDGLFADPAAQNVALRFGGAITADQAGVYSFDLASNAGTALYFNGVKVIDNSASVGIGAPKTVSLTLSAGVHFIELRALDMADAMDLSLQWEGPGLALQDVAAATGFAAAVYTVPADVDTLGDVTAFSGVLDRMAQAWGYLHDADQAVGDGSITVGDVSATDDVSLEASSDIAIGAGGVQNGGGLSLDGQSLTVTPQDGETALQVTGDALDLDLGAVEQGFTVEAGGDALTVGTVDITQGDFNLDAAGDVIVGGITLASGAGDTVEGEVQPNSVSIDAGGDITGAEGGGVIAVPGEVNLTAGGSITGITTDADSYGTVAAGGDVALVDEDGADAGVDGVVIGQVSSAAGDVTITAAGGIQANAVSAGGEGTTIALTSETGAVRTAEGALTGADLVTLTAGTGLTVADAGDGSDRIVLSAEGPVDLSPLADPVTGAVLLDAGELVILSGEAFTLSDPLTITGDAVSITADGDVRIEAPIEGGTPGALASLTLEAAVVDAAMTAVHEATGLPLYEMDGVTYAARTAPDPVTGDLAFEALYLVQDGALTAVEIPADASALQPVLAPLETASVWLDMFDTAFGALDLTAYGPDAAVEITRSATEGADPIDMDLDQVRIVNAAAARIETTGAITGASPVFVDAGNGLPTQVALVSEAGGISLDGALPAGADLVLEAAGDVVLNGVDLASAHITVTDGDVTIIGQVDALTIAIAGAGSVTLEMIGDVEATAISVEDGDVSIVSGGDLTIGQVSAPEVTGTVTLSVDGDLIDADAGADPGYDVIAGKTLTVVTGAIDPALSISPTDISRVAQEAPIFLAIEPELTAAENQDFAFSIEAIDPEGDIPSYRLEGADAALFDIELNILDLFDVPPAEVTFRSAPDFEAPADADGDGVYELTVVAIDSWQLETSRDISVRVTDVNEGPVGAADSYIADATRTLEIDALSGLLANDADIDGDALSATLLTDVAHGDLTLNLDGSFSYTPHAAYGGTDSFTYQLSDGLGGIASATVTLEVNGRPDAAADAYDVNRETEASFGAAEGLLANDVDDLTADLTATLVRDVDHGALTLNDDGSFSYISDAGYSGEDSFTYVATDARGIDSVETTVILTVDEVAVVEGGDEAPEELGGTDGDDEIDFGGGAFDTGAGGAGADVFVFDNAADGIQQQATVNDYTVGEDQIDLQGATVEMNFSWGGTTYLFMNGWDFDTLIVVGAPSFDDISFV